MLIHPLPHMPLHHPVAIHQVGDLAGLGGMPPRAAPACSGGHQHRRGRAGGYLGRAVCAADAGRGGLATAANSPRATNSTSSRSSPMSHRTDRAALPRDGKNFGVSLTSTFPKRVHRNRPSDFRRTHTSPGSRSLRSSFMLGHPIHQPHTAAIGALRDALAALTEPAA